MPYANLPDDPETIQKMDRCVEKVMAEGHDKSSAIAICYTSIKGSQSEMQAAIEWGEPSLEDVTYAHQMLGARPSGELLKFKNARLCPEGRNKNGDGVRLAGLHEMAASLALMPLDDEHDEQKVIGFFINPRVGDGLDEAGQARKYLLTDGLVYARRFPDEVADIRAGRKHLSVEAIGHQAECSVCEQVFTSAESYCDHLKHRPDNGATRWLSGLRATGGGATAHPAGPGAGFDPNGFVMVASLAGAPVDETPPKTPKEQTMENDELTARISELEATLKTVQAELAARDAELKASVDEVTALKAATTQMQANITAEQVSHERALVLLDAGFGLAEVQKMVASLNTLAADVFDVFVQTKREAKAVADKPQPRLTATALGDVPPQAVTDAWTGLFK